MRDSPIADPSLWLLTQVFAAATRHASLAMSRWTGGQVTLSFDEVREAPLDEVASQLDLDSDPLTMVVLGIQENPGAQLILAFDEMEGRTLAAALLGRDVSQAPAWSELEKSAIMETGNILASAYLSQLTRLLDYELLPSTPRFIQDFGASVLEQALAAQAMLSDRLLVCQTRFELNKQAVNWCVYFLPGRDLLRAIHTAIHSAA